MMKFVTQFATGRDDHGILFPMILVPFFVTIVFLVSIMNISPETPEMSSEKYVPFVALYTVRGVLIVFVASIVIFTGSSTQTLPVTSISLP